jgi:hypothetical protein
MSIRDYEELEAMKVESLKHCFKLAKADLNNDAAVDGESFLNSF